LLDTFVFKDALTRTQTTPYVLSGQSSAEFTVQLEPQAFPLH
jgi:hypothetical protein